MQPGRHEILETSLAATVIDVKICNHNLVTLCRHHHRAVHEGGFDVQMDPDGVPNFYDRRGRLIPEAPRTRFRGNVFGLMTANRRAGVDVSAKTCFPEWDGQRMDNDLVVESLFQFET